MKGRKAVPKQIMTLIALNDFELQRHRVRLCTLGWSVEKDIHRVWSWKKFRKIFKLILAK
jgi:hypothetical protein